MTDPSSVATVVGGVGELYQGDLDVGRRVADVLAAEDLGAGVAVEDFFYGAVAVVQRIEDLGPDSLVLVAAQPRGRQPGTLHRRRVPPPRLDAAQLQTAVGDAVTGYVALDLVVEVAAGLDALPGRVVAVEVEPVEVGPGDQLSPGVTTLLPRVVEQARHEARVAPLFVLVDRLAALLADGHLDDAPAVRTLQRLVTGLGEVEGSRRWGHAFSDRDELRGRLGLGQVPEGMDHRDWALAWNLVEELDRLEAQDVREGTSP